MAGNDGTATTVFSRRALLVGGVGGAMWLTLMARLFQLQVLQGSQFAQIADENSIRLDLEPPRRGDIIDRFGRPLASHRRAGRAMLVREQARDVKGLLRRVGELIDLPPDEQERIARDAARQPGFVPTLIARELTYEDFARLNAYQAELDGLQVEMALTRSYPRGRDLAHVIGYVARASDDEILRETLDNVAPGWTAIAARERAAARDAVGSEADARPDYSNVLGPDLARAYLRMDNAERLAYREREKDAAKVAALEGVIGRFGEVNRLFKHPDMRIGRSGVEFYADEYLRGGSGFRKVEANAAGRVIRELDSGDVAPKPGRDVVLTIDAELQRVAIERFGEESGAAVCIDVQSGDLLAVVSTPAFDPNAFVNGISTKDYNTLRDNDRAPLYHKAYDGTYPPGSTFKMVVAMAALEAGVSQPNERVYCPGHYRFGSNTWHCWKRGGHGSVNMHQAIQQSCDVYFYEVARRAGVDKIAEVAKRFGFGHVWELGMTGGRAGVVPTPEWKRATQGEPWFEGETINFGIGQGQLHTSPLQLALMTARIAADGRMVMPRLILDGPPVEKEAPGGAPFQREHLDLMKAGMYAVTSEAGGTAMRVGDLGLGGVRMAGKTGTAQVRRISTAERATGVRSNDEVARELRDHALFVGYAPADAPRYAVAVVVEHGGGGSSVAAPIAKDIMCEAIMRDSGAPPNLSRRSAALGTGEGGQ